MTTVKIPACSQCFHSSSDDKYTILFGCVLWVWANVGFGVNMFISHLHCLLFLRRLFQTFPWWNSMNVCWWTQDWWNPWNPNRIRSNLGWYPSFACSVGMDQNLSSTIYYQTWHIFLGEDEHIYNFRSFFSSAVWQSAMVCHIGFHDQQYPLVI